LTEEKDWDKHDADLTEKANEEHITEIRLGYNDEFWSVALEVYGRHRIVYPNGTSEVVNTKSSFCTCGQSRTKPFCDQTHQTLQMSNGKESLFNTLTNAERIEMMQDIKKEQYQASPMTLRRVENNCLDDT
tara:strand:- start:828 stop:1220 length:393 start_codon:yes stop_codon:yes gene_type:complete